MQSLTVKFEEFGITQSKRVFGIIGTAITSVAGIDQNKDKRVSGMEVLVAVQGVASKVFLEGIPDIEEFRKEGSDYDPAEKAALVQIIRQETTLASERIEYFIEEMIRVILDIADLIIEMVNNGKDDSDEGE